MSLALFMIVGAGVGAIAWGMRELSFFQAHQSLGNGGDKKEFVASATHVNWFTPREIALAIDRAGPLQKEDVANGFVNGQVDWSLPFFEVRTVKGNPARITVKFTTDTFHGPYVICEVDRKGNDYLNTLPRLGMFNVTGVIREIEPTSNPEIQLSQALFRPLSTRSEQLTPAQREQFVSVLRHAAGQRVNLISASVTDEAMEFRKRLKAAAEDAGVIIANEETETKLLRGYQHVSIVAPWLPTTHPFVENLPDMLAEAFPKIGIFPEVWRDSGGPKGSEMASPQDVTIVIE